MKQLTKQLIVDLSLPDAVTNAPHRRQYVQNIFLACRRTPEHERKLNAQVHTHTYNNQIARITGNILPYRNHHYHHYIIIIIIIIFSSFSSLPL